MNNKSILIDSSILIEYYKNAQTALLDELLRAKEVTLFISQVVLSEYLFHCLAVDGGKSPLSIKQSNDIGKTLAYSNHAAFLKQFVYLRDNNLLVEDAISYMSKFNLLPNDALILSLCSLHRIPAIASYDSDFSPACRELGIALLQTTADFEAF
jgi:uncharacterized protein